MQTFSRFNPIKLIDKNKIDLLDSTGSYNVERYPWAYLAWKLQQQVHWLPEEVPMSEDIRDWNTKLTSQEKNFLTQIFRLFTQSDIEVADNYMLNYMQVFQPLEVKMMLSAFSNIECFDKESELLTAKGWKYCKDVLEEDLVAQYDLASQEISFVKPDKVVSYDYDGLMHYYKGKTTDICVTPNHDLIVIHPSSKVVQKRKSYEGKWARNYLYPCAGIKIKGRDRLTILEKILIAVAADGTLRGLCPSAEGKHHRTCDVKFTKTRKIELFREYIKESGLRFSERLTNKGQTNFCFTIPKEIDLANIKTLGFLDLEDFSMEGAFNVVEEALKWDGAIHDTGVNITKAFYSTNEAAINKIQAFAVLGNVACIKGINRSAEQSKDVILPQGGQPKFTKTCYLLTFSDQIERTYPHRVEMYYKDKVYCVSVPKQNLISRRNGKIAITGNTVHLEAYALLLKTLGIDSSEFSAFRNYKQMSEKIDYLDEFNIRTCADVTRTLAMFGAFTEGLSLFASFAMLLNFPRNNKMKGMGQIISWSVRDESLHCEAMINLFHEWTRQTGTATKQIKQQITEIASWQVFLEDQFIDLAFQEGDFESLRKADIKEYIRYIAGWRLTQLKIKPLFGYFEEDKAGSYRQIKPHPLPWLLEILNGVEHANFFETRSTEYSKVATEGSWHGDDGVWTNFDAYNQRKSSAVQEV